MPWFKVDDTLHSHPKSRKVGTNSVGLWAVSGSYSMAYKTDGFVPDWYVKSWPSGERLAAKLVAANLWLPGVREDETGWYFKDWLHYQPSAEEIEADREKARERQRQRRQRLRDGKAKP